MPDTEIAVHAYDVDLESYVRGQLKPACISALEFHLLECHSCRERLAACLGQPLIVNLKQGVTKPERLEPRFSAEGEATLQELHPLSLDRQKVKILNVSKNGLCVVGPKATFPGTIVQLRIGKHVIELGNVRYCRGWGDNAFRIGLRMHDEF
jgi:hypothetical protein